MQSKITTRKIPSTIQRSRLSTRQQQIFDHELQTHCINLENIINIDSNTIYKLFGNEKKLILDIGFGNGEQLIELATKLPEYNFIGVELYKKGIVNLIDNINKYKINNIKIIFGDIKEIISKFTDHVIYKVQIFFPDPWPKLRHHKRRLIQIDLLNAIKQKLVTQGILHIITDHIGYAENIINLASQTPAFSRIYDHKMFRPTTKFEKIAKSIGNSISELVFVLK